MDKRSYWVLHKVTLTAAWRRKGASLLLTAVVFLGVFASMVLHNLVQRQEAALEDMKANTDIHCVVTHPQGTNSSDLQMYSSFVDRLVGLRREDGYYQDDYVKNLRALASSRLIAPADWSLHRIYSLDSDRALTEVEGASVRFKDGWSEEILQTRERVCLVPAGMPTFWGTDGKEYITIETRNSKTVDLQVIGTVTGGPVNTVYCPFYMQAEDGISEAYPVDTCSFDIRDNSRLEEAKAALYEMFVVPDRSNMLDGVHFGLIVQDDVYWNTIREFESNLTLLRLLLPILMVLSCCIGFFASYLTTRGRTKEFAVMRCLGMSRVKIFGLVFEELLVLTLAGGVAGLAAGFLLEGAVRAAAAANAALIAGIFLLGSAIAAIRITSVNVMKLMKVED